MTASPAPGVGPDAVPVSARSGEGINDLLAHAEKSLTIGLERVHCAVPTGRGDLIAWLKRAGRVVEEYYRDGIVTVTALVPPKVAGQLRKQLDGAPAEPPC